MNKKLIIIFHFTTIILLGCRSQSAELVVVNKSGETISTLNIELHKSKKHIENLNINEFIVVNFNSFTDSHYKVNGTFAGGNEFKTQWGYVTHGSGFIDTLIIYNDTTFYHSSNIKSLPY